LEVAIYRRTLPGEASPSHPAVRYGLVASGLQAAHLSDLGVSEDRITDEADVEEAVKYCRLSLASTHDGSAFPYLACMSLGFLLFLAFSCTDKIEYLTVTKQFPFFGTISTPGVNGQPTFS
jgi:hypothetical protein